MLLAQHQQFALFCLILIHPATHSRPVTRPIVAAAGEGCNCRLQIHALLIKKSIRPFDNLSKLCHTFVVDPLLPEARMSLQAHISELSAKHKALETKIQQEMNTPGYNDLTIAELKRRKLKLKDEINRLEAELAGARRH
jgi:hypothetical protein